MLCRAIDDVLKSLRVASKRHLAKCCHRQQTSQRVERFLLEYRVLFFKVLFQPDLKRAEQMNVRIEEAVHGGLIFLQQTETLEVRSRRVIQILAADLCAEVHVSRRLLDRLETDTLVFDELHRNLR